MERALRNGMDYKDIIKDAAKRKLIDLGKEFLDILDELKLEDAAKVQKIDSISGDLEHLRPFLYLLDETKVKILRKRILDKMNSLTRELEK